MELTGKTSDILCIGSVLWDVIGKGAESMKIGYDLPGRIERIPGGVAMNIAMALAEEGLRPVLLTHLGRDRDGEGLAMEAGHRGMITEFVTWSADIPTDQYMAIECPDGLVAAIADAHGLEAIGASVLSPLEDGRLGSLDAPYPGTIALDGNLTAALLAQIAASPLFASADLRVAPASPGKASRLRPLFDTARATIYVNRIEAGLILKREFETAAIAAEALRAVGKARVLVTDGGSDCALAGPEGLVHGSPPKVEVRRFTGAGDTLMASHIAAEMRGLEGAAALDAALARTARYVSESP